MIVIFHRSFKKRYKKIPFKIRHQFDQRLTLFEREPLHPILSNHSLTGDWRAIFREDGNYKFVTFETIGTHSQLYK